MVDILDMEDILLNLVVEWSGEGSHKPIPFVKRLIREVSDFVEAQQTIKCVNCKGYKFSKLKSWNR